MNKEKEENLEEMSSMAAGGVEGGSGAPKKKKRKMPEGYYIDRKSFIEEMQLREVIRETIKKIKRKKKSLLEEQQRKQKNDEKQLRSIVRFLIKEAKKDIEDTPHASTAINILEDLLKQILPNLETDYKILTTKKEQRDSFRAHIVSAVSSALDTEDVNKAGGSKMLGLDETETNEEVEVKVKEDEDEFQDEKFIDIDPEEPVGDEAEEEEDTFGIEGQDETGRAMAQQAFNNIEKNVIETYDILSDPEDEKLFKDYLITNLKLYFDKWEKELGAVVEPTTSEYETEKEEGEDSDELDAELGGELGGEPPTEETGEELIQ